MANVSNTSNTSNTYSRHHSTSVTDRQGLWGTLKLAGIIALIIILFAICEGI